MDYIYELKIVRDYEYDLQVLSTPTISTIWNTAFAAAARVLVGNTGDCQLCRTPRTGWAGGTINGIQNAIEGGDEFVSSGTMKKASIDNVLSEGYLHLMTVIWVAVGIGGG